MDNADLKHSIDHCPADNQLPCQWMYEYPTNVCLSSYARQPASLLANAHIPPLPLPTTAEQLALSTGHLPYGSLHTPSATGTSVDFSMASNPAPSRCRSQWSGMSSNLAHETYASVAPPQNQYQIPYEFLCGWSRDFEPHPIVPVSPSIPSVPYSLPPMLTHSYPNTEQYDAWMRHVLGESVGTCPSSADGDTGLSASGFLGAFAEFDFFPDARSDDSQPSIALTRDATDAMPSIQSAAFSSNEPTYGPYRQSRFFECQWLTNGVLCGTHVNADRRSVVGHLQDLHGIKPGEEKARETCLWEQCETILNKESLARHILTVHLKERVHCDECGLLFAREDSLKRHLKGGRHKVPFDKGAARQPSRTHAQEFRWPPPE